jgi:hypothetical protein
MYFPLLRNKAEEIRTLVALSNIIQPGGKVLPIIEPVRDQGFNNLVRANIPFIVIANPSVPAGRPGPLSPGHITNNIIIPNAAYPHLIVGVRISPQVTPQQIQNIGNHFNTYRLAFIHSHELANTTPAALNAAINNLNNVVYNIFEVDKVSAAYVQAFTQIPKVELQDNFNRRANNINYPNYPSSEFFTRSHLNYRNNGFQGIGDYLTIGRFFSTTGGGAYTIAIHLTYDDPTQSNEVYINHYVSTNAGGRANQGGKFLAACQLLVNSLNGPLAHINTIGSRQFIAWHNAQHHPGLPSIKRFSMIHHIELMERLV